LYERDTGEPLPSKLSEPDWHAFALEIRRRAALYRQRWPGIELTPTALAVNWSRVTLDVPGASLPSALMQHAEHLREEGR